MKCSRCSHENPADAKFCEECASPLERSCTNCRAQLRPSAKFCPQCAHPAGQAISGEHGKAQASSYTPKHLADKILTSRTAIEGERKQVTVLFADLTGSMELLADRDPEEARAILDPVLGHMMDAVHQYEGTVNQVMGDGIMALFGAPLALEDHAVRACYAAKRMQERISRYGDEVQRQHGVPIQLRIGLHSGEVVVRSIGSDLKMDYSAIGQTTHLAARMEQTAKPGTILATSYTVKLAEGFIQVNPLGPVAVKGMSEPIEVFELTGALVRRSRLRARAASGGLTQFVGRQREFEVLAEAAKNAKCGKGHAVAIVGEPGVGKSRLYWEFTHSPYAQGCLVVEASSVSYGKATSFLPVIDLLKSYFQIGERDDARSVKEKLTGKLLTLERRFETLLPPLLDLLDQPVEDEQWQQFEPPQRRRQTLEALKRLWLREALNQPLILVFEDLHWIDSETQELLNEFLDKIASAHILLLLNYRPEYQSPWGSKTFYTQLRLDALPTEGASELLADLLGSDPALEPLKEMLVKRGNPFFLEETVRTLIETGTLKGERGAYTLTKPIEMLQIPATVQAILAARIDRLDTEDKRLLQTASVIGKDVPFELLKAIADVHEAQLNKALMRLQAAEFVYETALYPDVEYSFKHALTHEVAYGELTQERKRRLHATIVDAMERLYADRFDEHIERLAHHAQLGEVWDKAVEYLRRAGQRAFGRSANAEAIKWWQQTLDAAEHLPEGNNKTEQQIDTRLNLRLPFILRGPLSRALELTIQAQALAQKIDDRYRTARALAYEAHLRYLTCDLARALAAAEQAIQIAQRENYLDVHLIASAALPMIVWARRGAKKGKEICRSNLEFITRTGDKELFGLPAIPAVYVRCVYTHIIRNSGEFTKAISLIDEALEISRRASHSQSEAFTWFFASAVYAWKGDFSHAVRDGEKAAAIYRSTDSDQYYNWAAMFLGYAYALYGRPSEGIKLLTDCDTQFEKIGLQFGRITSLPFLAEAWYHEGRLSNSLRTAHKALMFAEEMQTVLYVPVVLELLGRIYSHADYFDPLKAQRFYKEALKTSAAQDYHVTIAHCRAGLGRLHQKTDNKENAREELMRACEMYRAMDMAHYLHKAQESLGEI
jgi:class 3 adenylate cyclase/tetratricopeptide (TPR) repeat protein